MKQRILSVSKLTQYIKNIFNNDVILRNVLVEGEISNFKLHFSGHAYFSLKDNDSRIQCVMFRNVASGVPGLKDGDNVVMSGSISVYEKNGQYQLYVQSCEKKGQGDLFIQFEKLKSELEYLGWFDQKKKKKIPLFSSRICLVTSPTGAAVRDMISVISRRNPHIKILIYPVLVQGPDAAREISAAINNINRFDGADVIITGRGGGSIEELWAFNERVVAESIFNSNIPVISAVGHETDFTISDFVADLRAPTPSAAGELAALSYLEYTEKLTSYQKRLKKDIVGKIDINRLRVNRLKVTYFFDKPEIYFRTHSQTLDLLRNGLETAIRKSVDDRKIAIMKLRAEIKGINPKEAFKKGYVALKNKEGTFISDIDRISIGDKVDIVFKNGVANSLITGKGRAEDEKEQF
ncbi:MAG: exodeoxyribonuclease VII large subunit [Eubacteriaceae bacterium]|nr:exodeoxyribonuclease VII large subunit [Eubacteriaceae bacterium]